MAANSRSTTSYEGAGEPPVKVLYIIGAGRSGSTILDITLGNHPEIESVGELRNITDSAWVGREKRSPFCACGRHLDAHGAAEVCPFWSDVRRRWLQGATPDEVADYVLLQNDFERLRSWRRLLRERYAPSARFRDYQRLTRGLFESIRAASEKTVIVDSSKSPLRAVALAMTPGIDLRLIHLVRDGRGVTSSRRKSLGKDPKAGVWWNHEARSVWNTAASWVGANLAAEGVRRRVGPERSVRVRYEDFATDPVDTMAKIGELVGLDLTELARAAAAGVPLKANHNVGGNRMRMSKDIRLRPDAGEWRRALSAREQRLSWALMGRLMLRYGYKK
jgi:hypothetical protein